MLIAVRVAAGDCSRHDARAGLDEARAMDTALAVLIVSGYADVEGIAPDLPRLTKSFRSSDLHANIAQLLPEVDYLAGVAKPSSSQS
jgi:hypothetical protein